MPIASQAKYVSTSQELNRLAQSLSQSKTIAVDTESNSLHAYQEQVCLIQFTNEDGDFLVDPLALSDLSPFAAIFSNPQIEKIFHAAEYDLIVLHRDYGFEIANLFDTMVAARIIGKQKVGLGSLLESEFQIVLAKKYQRADWGKRPIKPEMLEYARMDTHYLVQLRDKLEADLKTMNRWEIAQEDFARLPRSILNNHQTKEDTIWRIKGIRDLDPSEVAILNELAQFRDQQAQRADVPLFKIIGDRTLVAIAAMRPQRLQNLEEIKGMTPGQIRRFGKGLLAAVQKGSQASAIKRPRGTRYDPEYSDRLEQLRNWRKLTARKLNVESDVVLPRDVMEQIASENPESVSGVEALLTELPWRQSRYSANILEALQPKD